MCDYNSCSVNNFVAEEATRNIIGKLPRGIWSIGKTWKPPRTIFVTKKDRLNESIIIAIIIGDMRGINPEYKPKYNIIYKEIVRAIFNNIYLLELYNIITILLWSLRAYLSHQATANPIIVPNTQEVIDKTIVYFVPSAKAFATLSLSLNISKNITLNSFCRTSKPDRLAHIQLAVTPKLIGTIANMKKRFIAAPLS